MVLSNHALLVRPNVCNIIGGIPFNGHFNVGFEPSGLFRSHFSDGHTDPTHGALILNNLGDFPHGCDLNELRMFVMIAQIQGRSQAISWQQEHG